MAKIVFNLFPGGLNKAVTFSYDDGRTDDRRLVAIFNRHGMKASFHLNSRKLGNQGYLEAREIKSLFTGHEVSVHTTEHPALEQGPATQVVHQVWEDRKRLESLVEYPVRGMSYPYGTYSAEIASLLPSLGIRYSRTVASHRNYHLPPDFLTWHPTLHHKHRLLEKVEDFLNKGTSQRGPQLLYVWGHSYEFPQADNWNVIEEACERLASDRSLWRATNLEICDYVTSLKRLEFSADHDRVYNPSAIPLWFTANDKPFKIEPGVIREIQP